MAEINGALADRRLAIRQQRVKPLVGELKSWMETERVRLPRHAATAKAIDYMLKRWPAFTRFLDESMVGCLGDNRGHVKTFGTENFLIFCRF